jgi:predicted transcriptional regulator
VSTREVVRLEIEELEAIREEIEKRVSAEAETLQETPRWNADPENVQRSVARLVLTLVEFVRRLLERQAIRRMEAETLTPEEIEAIGLALMKLEETVQDIAGKFGLDPDELNLDLGPLGRLI